MHAGRLDATRRRRATPASGLIPGGRATRDEDGIHETGHVPSPCGISRDACIFAICSLWSAGAETTFPEQLYIDFDGFFAACEEQADRRLQGRSLGVIPFAGAVNSCVIAANTMAKRAGVTTGMAIADARRRCPGIALVPQQPDLYTRIHHRIVTAVLDVLPIDAVCSIDEFAATVEPRDIPAALTHQIKQRLRDAALVHGS